MLFAIIWQALMVSVPNTAQVITQHISTLPSGYIYPCMHAYLDIPYFPAAVQICLGILTGLKGAAQSTRRIENEGWHDNDRGTIGL